MTTLDDLGPEEDILLDIDHAVECARQSFLQYDDVPDDFVKVEVIFGRTSEGRPANMVVSRGDGKLYRLTVEEIPNA